MIVEEKGKSVLPIRMLKIMNRKWGKKVLLVMSQP